MLNVVDSVGDDALEVHIEKARQIDPDAQLGGVLEKEIDPGSLGRIAAQAARQAIMQRIRQFERIVSTTTTRTLLVILLQGRSAVVSAVT